MGNKYAESLKQLCKNLNINFWDMNMLIRDNYDIEDKWIFVDRAHFTDDGYNLAAKTIASRIF